MNKLVILSICAVLSANCSDQASSSSRIVNREATQALYDAIRENDLRAVEAAISNGADLRRTDLRYTDSISAIEVATAAQFRKLKFLTSPRDVFVSSKIFRILVQSADRDLLASKLFGQAYGLGLLESILDVGGRFVGNEKKIAKIYAMIAQRHLELGVKPKFSGLNTHQYLAINDQIVNVNDECLAISELVEKLKAMPDSN